MIHHAPTIHKSCDTIKMARTWDALEVRATLIPDANLELVNQIGASLVDLNLAGHERQAEAV